MIATPTRASLAVVSYGEDFGYSISTISVDHESCALTGAWHFATMDEYDLVNILHARLIVTLGGIDGKAVARRFRSQHVDLNSFIEDASNRANDGLNKFKEYLERSARQYSEYMSVSPSKRKSLAKVTKKQLEPIFAHSWNLQFDESKPELTLRQLKKRELIEGTPLIMKRVIATSWLIKHLIDRWREDEKERSSRNYIFSKPSPIQLLPKSWMESLEKLNGGIEP